MKPLRPRAGGHWTVGSWLRRLLSGKPHFVIGADGRPYMLRWYLVPRNRLFNLYLHKFLRDDDDRALHDHPWWFVSFVIKGTYREIVEDGSIVRRRFLCRLPTSDAPAPRRAACRADVDHRAHGSGRARVGLLVS